MPLPERVLIDGSAFLALLFPNHTDHEVAVRNYERLIDREQELWVTSSTLLMVARSVLEQTGVDGFRRLNDSISGIIHVYWINPKTYEEAIRLIIDRAYEGNLGLEECLAAVVAKQIQAHVFAFDDRFVSLGIPTLPREIRVRGLINRTIS